MLLACGSAMVLGSFNSWYAPSIFGSPSVSGIRGGLLGGLPIGNITNVAGIVLAACAFLLIVAGGTVFGDLLGQLAPAAAGAGIATVIYVVDASKAYDHLKFVGWGLYRVAIASLVALIASSQVNQTSRD